MIAPAKSVLRYFKGNLLKDYSQDFPPTAQYYFHVRCDMNGGSETGQQVSPGDLRAVVYVRDITGNNAYKGFKIIATGKPLS